MNALNFLKAFEEDMRYAVITVMMQEQPDHECKWVLKRSMHASPKWFLLFCFQCRRD